MEILRTNSLYDQDFNLWCEDTAEKIRTADYAQIYWENLLEELAGLAGRDRRELVSRLTTLYEHLLKLRFFNLPNNFRGWNNTIMRSQFEISNILQESPSLASYFAKIKDKCYSSACKLRQGEYDEIFRPAENCFPSEVDQLLDLRITFTDEQSTRNFMCYVIANSTV